MKNNEVELWQLVIIFLLTMKVNVMFSGSSVIFCSFKDAENFLLENMEFD